MTLESYDIVGSYNNQRVLNIDAERSVNLFEYIDAKGKKDKTLIFTSGLENSGITFINSGGSPQTGAFRASFAQGNFHYHVIGNGVYIVNTSNVASQIGTLGTTAGYVGIEANQTQIIFVDGVNGWIWDTQTSVFVQITDPSFPVNPLDVTYLDGFFTVISGNTNAFQLSKLNQGLVWGPIAGGGSTNTFTIAAASSDVTLTSGTNANYQIGTTVRVATSTASQLPAGNYFVVFKSGSNIIRLSASNGGAPITSVTGGSGTLTNDGQLQQAFVTSHPGTLVACRCLHRRIFFFSQNFTEVWENAGIGTNLPFRRNNSLLMEFGCSAVGSVVAAFDKLFFLAQDRGGLGAVMEVIGTEAIPVSNRALDFQLAQYMQDENIGVADARSILIKDNGLIFYRLNFTKANHTFIYNVTLSNPTQEEGKLWHEEEVLNGDRHPAQTQVFFNGDNYYGDYKSNNLYFVSSQFVTNNGESIRRMRIGRPITPPTYQRLRIDRFHLDLLQGTVDEQSELSDVIPILTQSGLEILAENGNFLMTESSSQDDSDISIPTANPVCFLSYSKDGGHTYGNKLIGPMGKIGERSFRTVWRKLGTVPRGQGFVPKIEFFSQLPFVILGAAWVFEVMPE